ncbi:glycerol kinase GlpK [Parvibacter caecicola]|uniref:glycerol kinase GlpK n=1 Tax=Parvibacter caecicola TaxID=747645 RepID=UPI0023F32170|nr:glycerol kinase GlpK [Parvibacter caecicola]
MSERFIIALDQGTTSSRALLVDKAGRVRATVQNEFPQIYPQPGWVEHDPRDILATQLGALTELLVSNNLSAADIDSLAITNQRETTIVWDRETGQPVYNAIVWQCRRTAPQMEEMAADEQLNQTIVEKTGLVPDAYFSASKIKWILDNVEGAREAAEAGRLAFGTVDTWLLWTLTRGAVHATDPTNASRTLLFNIHTMEWDPFLLELFGIPASMLPEVRPSAGFFGETATDALVPGVPICGIAGDQQAALFGQCCFSPGQAKNTYGTGCFLLMHTGTTPCRSSHNLITTIAASAPGAPGPEYALEGSVFMGGALMQWIRDGLGLLEDVAESSAIARSVPDNGGVVIVPAFTGMGAPYWDGAARGIICGLTRGTTSAHIVRAALEALAFQVHDLVRAMEADAPLPLSVLNVDGGASANDFLMQFQSDVLRCRLHRPQNCETTAMGAAYLAGLATGFWESTAELEALRSGDDVYHPGLEDARHAVLLERWNRAVGRCLYRP